MSYMRRHRFGSGDEMPLLGLGTWKSEPGEVHAAVKEAVRIGYRHIDCAAIYGNEAEIGRALSECFAEGLVERNEMWITSKLWNDSHAPGDVLPALEKTLSDLSLDHLDLYLVHWPVAQGKGVLLPESAADLISPDELPAAKTWAAMEAAVDEGLCRHIGVSNFSVPKTRALIDSARIAPEVSQVELHPYFQQPELVEFCRKNRILVTAYSPLGSKDRPAMFKRKDEPILLEDPTIGEIADRHGASAAQVLIGWAMHRGTSVIPKSVSAERLRQNFAAQDVALGEEDMRRIEGLERGFRYVTGDFFVVEGGPYTLASLWDQ